MRLLVVLAAAAGVSGCAKGELHSSLTYGLLRVEPHPIHADSAKVTTVASTMLLDPLGRGTSEGYRNVVISLFGPECANAPIIEEGRVRLVTGREDAVLR